MNRAQSQPDFTGLWEVNFEKSTMRGQQPSRILMKIEHREPKVIQMIFVSHATGAEERLTFEYTTDGEESINSIRGNLCRTRAHWDRMELVIESSMKAPDREFNFKDCWSLSSDGRMLTMAHRNDDLAGQISVLEKAPPEAATKFE